MHGGGVDPLPATLTKAWPLPSGRWVAVVNVRPAAIPPCITSSGEVWERLSGKSVRVTDSASLRRLFERGEAARDRAIQLAVSGREPPEGLPTPVIAICMAAPSLPGDISAVLFREATADLARGLMDGPLRADPMLSSTVGTQSQHALITWSATGLPDDRGFVLRVGRHGSVAVSRFDEDLGSALDAFASDPEYLRRMWLAGVSMLKHLGAFGPTPRRSPAPGR